MSRLTSAILRQLTWTGKERLRKRAYPPETAANISYFLENVDCGAPAWKFVTESVRYGDVDRRASLISGPNFTSRSFPWPERDGFFMKPVIQLDLAEITMLSGLPFGDGFLQLWVQHHDYDVTPYLRTIPRSQVLNDDLSSMPDLFTLKNYRKSFYQYEREYGLKVSDECMCQQVISYAEPSFMIPDAILTGALDDVPEHDLSKADLRLLKSYERACHDCVSTGGTHLFGTFPAPGYWPEERPMPLVCLASEDDWGDRGYAQIFVNFDPTGSPEFACEWGNYGAA